MNKTQAKIRDKVYDWVRELPSGTGDNKIVDTQNLIKLLKSLKAANIADIQLSENLSKYGGNKNE